MSGTSLLGNHHFRELAIYIALFKKYMALETKSNIKLLDFKKLSAFYVISKLINFSYDKCLLSLFSP